MSHFAILTGEVHDEALRYVYALGGAPLLRTLGAFGLLALLAYCAARLKLAFGRRETVRAGASACARP